MGFNNVMCWMSGGMLAMGVEKPERITEGTTKRKVPRMACCWVRASEETIRPTPATARMYNSRPA